MQNESLTLKVTPAGKLFMRFISTFNSNDPQKIREFMLENYAPNLVAELDYNINSFLEMFSATGGLDIYKVYLSEEHFIIVITQSRLNGKMFMDKLKVTGDRPHLITEYYHEAAK